jgi:hypothetical protein
MIASRPVRGDLEIYEVPANNLAKQVGQDKVANMVKSSYHPLAALTST